MRTAAVFFLGTALSRLVSFALLPVITAKLTPAQYGVYDFWTTMLGFLAPVFFFQIWDSLYRFYFDETDKSRLTTNSLAILAGGMLLYGLCWCVPLVALGVTHSAAISLIGLTTGVHYFLGFLVRAQLKNGIFIASGVVNTLVASATTLTLLYTTDLRTGALLWGVVLGNVLQILILGLNTRHALRPTPASIDRPLMVRLLRYALPLCAVSVSAWLLAGFARVSITAFVGAEGNGLFAIAERFAFPVALIGTIVIFAWNEVLFTSHRADDALRVKGEGFSHLASVVFLGASFAVLLMSVAFDLVVDAEFHAARVLVPLSITVAAANLVGNMLGSIFLSAYATTQLLVTSLYGAAAHVGLSLALTPQWGLWGAVTALLLGNLVIVALRWRQATHAHGVRFDHRTVFACVAVLAGTVGLFWIDPGPWVVGAAMLLVALHAGWLARGLLRGAATLSN